MGIFLSYGLSLGVGAGAQTGAGIAVRALQRQIDVHAFLGLDGKSSIVDLLLLKFRPGRRLHRDLDRGRAMLIAVLAACCRLSAPLSCIPWRLCVMPDSRTAVSPRSVPRRGSAAATADIIAATRGSSSAQAGAGDLLAAMRSKGISQRTL